MATRTVTHMTDDLDGSAEDVDTVTFALHGATYEIDLSKDNQKKLEEALEPFLNVARRAGGGTRRATPRASGAAASSGGTGVDAKAVRAWAAENGITVPSRGRIPNAVVEQYRAAS